MGRVTGPGSQGPASIVARRTAKMLAEVRAGVILLVTLNPTRGRESRKARKFVSPHELSAHMGTFIVAPLTSGSHAHPFRIACRFAGKYGHVALDQTRTVDQERLGKRLGTLKDVTMVKVLEAVQNGVWNVIYYETLLGRFDERTRTITGASSLKKDC